VYSTELGRTCPSCRKPRTYCTCRQASSALVGDGNVRVGRETKGRNGKGVTVISGVPLAPADLQALTTHLKKRCGSGGTSRTASSRSRVTTVTSWWRNCRSAGGA
jgi:translation initiation factor 1